MAARSSSSSSAAARILTFDRDAREEATTDAALPPAPRRPREQRRHAGSNAERGGGGHGFSGDSCSSDTGPLRSSSRFPEGRRAEARPAPRACGRRSRSSAEEGNEEPDLGY